MVSGHYSRILLGYLFQNARLGRYHRTPGLQNILTMPTNPVSQVAIIGIGAVGGAAAFALILSSIASELLLVDIDTKLRDGQVRDLSDVAFSTNSPTHVRAATHHEAGQCDIIVITAGSKCTIGKRSCITSVNVKDPNG